MKQLTPPTSAPGATNSRDGRASTCHQLQASRCSKIAVRLYEALPGGFSVALESTAVAERAKVLGEELAAKVEGRPAPG